MAFKVTVAERLMIKMKYYVACVLLSKSKYAFMKTMGASSTVLDVGCGNNWPLFFKTIRPDCCYIGVDVGDYRQKCDVSEIADRYVLTTPDEFDLCIAGFNNQIDSVISSHNLEHCLKQERVLRAMCQTLKSKGTMYLSFPCEESIYFPSRKGTLNFYDDITHSMVPKLDSVTEIFVEEGMKVVSLSKRYRPLIPAIIGLLFEPVSVLTKRSFSATWALYGFETIILSRKCNYEPGRTSSVTA